MLKRSVGTRKHFDPVPPAAGTGDAPPLTEARVTELVSAGIKSFQDGAFKKFADGVPTADVIKTMLTEALASGVTPPASGVTPPASGVTPPASGSPQENAALKAVQKELDAVKKQQGEEKTKREAAEAREVATAKDAAIRTALQDLKFVSPDAYQDAYNAVASQVTRTDDGQFVAGDLPVAAFAKDFVPQKKGYLLEPVNVGGGGAQRGVPTAGGKPASMEMISANMTKEELQAVGAAIKNALPGAMGR